MILPGVHCLDHELLTVRRSDGVLEDTLFGSADEARMRADAITEALSWVGTPFKNCSDIKGRQGGIDCAMFLVRTFVDIGRLAPFDPRPYPPGHMLHKDDERFIGWIEGKLHFKPTGTPHVGDCAVFFFGKCFSHGGVIINSEEIVHAYNKGGVCQTSRFDESELTYAWNNVRRPVRFYNSWY